MRQDYLHIVEVLLDLQASGFLGKDRNRVHVLGRATLCQAVMLSAIQRSMREILADDEFLITFDTSSPSSIAANGWAYGHAQLREDAFNMAMFKPPSFHTNAGDETPFPVRTSAIADRMVIGDLIAPSSKRQHGTNGVAGSLMTHHNTEALLRGIDEANSVMELPGGWKDNLAPAPIIAAYEALSTFWQYPRDPIAHLRRSAAHFKAIVKWS